MKMRTLLGVAAALAMATFSSLGSAQNPLKVDKNKLKIDSHKTNVHPRQLAFNNKDGRHQPRLLGKRDRHNARKSVRGVTHHLTAPHKPTKS